MTYNYDSSAYIMVTDKSLARKEFDKFLSEKCFFAFSNNQFELGKIKLGVAYERELCSMGNGGFMRRSDVKEFSAKSKALETELKTFLERPENFYNALVYELFNHEYIYNPDAPEEAMEDLGLKYDELPDEHKTAYKKAVRYVWEKSLNDEVNTL